MVGIPYAPDATTVGPISDSLAEPCSKSSKTQSKPATAAISAATGVPRPKNVP